MGLKFRKNTLETLSYLPLDWDCRFEEETKLPAFKGSMLRGALGHALKSVVCAMREKNCDRCLVRNNCLYAKIFEYKPNRVEQDQTFAAFPHPYVLEYPTETEVIYRPNKPFRFRTILIGPAVESFPYWIYSIQKMGQSGLGPRQASGRRSQFQLTQVSMGDQVLYKDGQQGVVLPEKPPELSWEERHSELGRLTVRLETPLRFKSQNRLATDTNFTELVRLSLRRIKALQEGFQVKLEPDNVRELLPKSGAVKTVRKELRWQEQTRFSTRQGGHQQMGGLVGELDVEGDLKPFWPLLQMAGIAHLGKETSFGLGQISMIT